MTFNFRYPGALLTAILAFGMNSTTSSSGQALADEPTDVIEVLSSVTEKGNSPELQILRDVAPIEPSVGSASVFSATVHGSEIAIPSDPSRPITVTESGETVEISVPFAGHAAHAEAILDGVAYYDNLNGSKTVPVVKSDGVIQLVTLIEDASAPTRYSYEFDSSGGLNISLEGQTAILRSTNEELIGVISPPWAVDAYGRNVPTWFEVHGTVLTQVVDHDVDTSFPVVADPTYSRTLFTAVSTDTWGGQPRVNLTPGWWTAAIAAPLLDVEGWSEVTTQWGTYVRDVLKSKLSMRQQFQCHAYGSWFAGEWNLEKARPTRTVSWTFGVAVHHCNWSTPNGN